MTTAGGLRFLALNGSSRASGTTGEALSLAGEHLATRGVLLDVVHLTERRVVSCRCGRCNSRPDPCPVDDDVADIVRSMESADALLYAAPVHGFGMAGTMQLFVERAGVGCLRFGRPLTNKVGGVVVVGRRYAHEAVHAQLVHNLLLNRMIVPGSGFPVTVRAGGPGDVCLDTEGVSALLAMLDRMHGLAEVLRDHPVPAPGGVEQRIGTLS